MNVVDKLAGIDWRGVEGSLDEAGCAVTPPLLDVDACVALRASYDDGEHFRSTVVMARHGSAVANTILLPIRCRSLVEALARRRSIRGSLRIANRLERGDRERASASRSACGHSDALPRRGPDATDAAAPAYGGGRLQLPASGSLRRARLPVAGRILLSGTRTRISPAANSCSPNSGRACNRARGRAAVRRATRSVFAVHSGLCAGHAAPTGSTAAWRQPPAVGQRHTLGIIFHDAA